MKGVYLASCIARHENYDIVYNDYDPKYNCDLTCDMMCVDLNSFDFIIASPPCNFWSRANWRYLSSDYSLNTKHLLPDILIKLAKLGKPFIVENVMNKTRFRDYGIFDICSDYNINVYYVGRHTYFTNINIDLNCEQVFDNIQYKYHNSLNPLNYRQGGVNVHNVIEIWLDYVVNNHLKNPLQLSLFDFME